MAREVRNMNSDKLTCCHLCVCTNTHTHTQLNTCCDALCMLMSQWTIYLTDVWLSQVSWTNICKLDINWRLCVFMSKHTHMHTHTHTTTCTLWHFVCPVVDTASQWTKVILSGLTDVWLAHACTHTPAPSYCKTAGHSDACLKGTAKKSINFLLVSCIY